MKQPNREGLASRSGREFYAADGNFMGVATTEVYAGQPLSFKNILSNADTVPTVGRQYLGLCQGE